MWLHQYVSNINIHTFPLYWTALTAGVNIVGLAQQAGLAGATKAAICHAQFWALKWSTVQDSIILASNEYNVGLEKSNCVG